MRSGRGAAKAIALVVYIIVILVATPQAQQHASFSGAPGAITAGSAPAAPNATAIDLLVGRSTILNVAAPISRVSLTVPDIADALVTSPQQLLIHGKTPGTISLFVWDRAGGITTYEVNVRRDLSQLVEQMKQLFPGEPISIAGSGKDVVISGTVSSKYVVDKAADVAGGYVEKKENVVNLLKQQEGVASNQVMLRVRFAEVSRSALQELGANFFTGPGGFHDYIAQSTTAQFPTINYSELDRSSIQGANKYGGGVDTVDGTGGKYTFSDLLNFMIFNNKYNVGTLIKALQDRGLFQSLAEPNLIALNGKEASFLAGGEYPYPVVQPGTGGNSITIMFKEFGIRLNFTPTVMGGDMIDLKVRPEVSSLDFSNAIVLDGFRIPALSTRRTDTEVELQDGQTFAIAGLLSNSVQNTMRKIPGVGDVPVLGWLFKSAALQKNQTELVVMITPTIVRRASTGVSQGLPNLVQPFLDAPKKSMPAPPPYTGSPVTPATRQPKKSGGDDTPQPQSQPAPTAAQTPSTHDRARAEQPTSAPAPAQPVAPQPVVTQQPVPAQEPAVTQHTSSAATASAAPKAQDPKPDPKALKKQQDADRKAAQEREAAEKKAAAEKAAADKEAARQKAIDDKKAADEKAAADKKEAEENARQQKLLAERGRREQEVAKKNAELEKKRQDDEKKQDKAINDAAARLKAAQAAYQAEIDKKNKGGQ
jgi:pilus assembly protein CpaC